MFSIGLDIPCKSHRSAATEPCLWYLFISYWNLVIQLVLEYEGSKDIHGAGLVLRLHGINS